MKYLKRYLQIAPFSLALWRALEAQSIDRIFSLRKIPKPSLDIGCGFGEFAGVFDGSLIEVGLDICKSDLTIAAKEKKYSKLILADARKLPFKDNKFRTIISISTLEHINDTKKVFKETFRVLRPGGNFIFTIPTSTLNSSLILPFPRVYWLKFFHYVFKHKVIMEKEKWLLAAEEAGFKVLDCQGLISRKQVLLFELGLPFALPTQLFRLIFKKRLPISPKIRTLILYYLLKSSMQDKSMTDSNVLIIAQKSL